MKRLLTAVTVAFVATVTLLGAAPAQADPGPMCSFQGEYFTQYYPCIQPPSWLMQPGVRSDMKPGVGTGVGPFNQ